MPDRARVQTDKKLNQIDKELGRMYRVHPALIAVKKEYAKYMEMVKEETENLYQEYLDTGTNESKKAYTDAVRKLTIESPRYKKLVKKITEVLAQVNQEALNVVNNSMVDIYTMNYNQVAVDCREVGIKVEQ